MMLRAGGYEYDQREEDGRDLSQEDSSPVQDGTDGTIKSTSAMPRGRVHGYMR